MLISNYICDMVIIFNLFSVILLICPIIAKNKSICKSIIIIDIVYIIYLCINLVILPSMLKISFSFGILVLAVLAIFSVVLLVISIIISCIKIKKLQINIKSKKAIAITITLLALPIVTFLAVFFREKYIIDTSDLILEYRSKGNGSFDGYDFAYAISDDFCEPISIGTELNGYYIKNFLPKSSFEIDMSEMQDLGYEIIIDSTRILIYKDGKCIHQRKHDGDYFNIELKKVFEIRHKY